MKKRLVVCGMMLLSSSLYAMDQEPMDPLEGTEERNISSTISISFHKDALRSGDINEMEDKLKFFKDKWGSRKSYQKAMALVREDLAEISTNTNNDLMRERAKQHTDIKGLFGATLVLGAAIGFGISKYSKGNSLLFTIIKRSCCGVAALVACYFDYGYGQNYLAMREEINKNCRVLKNYQNRYAKINELLKKY